MCVGADASFSKNLEIFPDAIHGASAKRLDAGGFERFEDGGGFRVRRG